MYQYVRKGALTLQKLKVGDSYDEPSTVSEPPLVWGSRNEIEIFKRKRFSNILTTHNLCFKDLQWVISGLFQKTKTLTIEKYFLFKRQGVLPFFINIDDGYYTF